MEKLNEDQAPEAEPYPTRQTAIEAFIEESDNTKLELYFEGVDWDSLQEVYTNTTHGDTTRLLEGEVDVKQITEGGEKVFLPVLIVSAESHEDETGNVFTKIVYAAKPSDVEELQLTDYFSGGPISL